MKKLVVTLLLAAMTLSVVACGGKKNDDTTEPSSSVVESSVEESTQESSEVEESTEADDGEVTEGVTAQDLRDAVVAALGEDYMPNMEMPADYLEGMYGITADMYDAYVADMPMVSANVDTLIVIQPKEGKLEDVKAALEAYHESKTSDESLRFEYPNNIGKVMASRVDVIGDFVCFIQLGGDQFSLYETEGDEAVMAECQKANQAAVDAMKAVVEQ
ncbi:MAG: DUF4358 domain-containing protein [Lachnospiraceae bacterium]|nr:DUF4358 domain-containing protein [Lachnospiraceae bacterium]